ncbi:MAG: BrnT family toxin [Candidatus Eisenbacteria bacterium]
MRVAWDPQKAKANFLKHGVRFSDAEGALSDPNAISREDRFARGEFRYALVGADYLGRVVVVVYTYRVADVRVISARRATRKERLEYEEGIRF